jgi:hypothetical protein
VNFESEITLRDLDFVKAGTQLLYHCECCSRSLIVETLTCGWVDRQLFCGQCEENWLYGLHEVNVPYSDLFFGRPLELARGNAPPWYTYVLAGGLVRDAARTHHAHRTTWGELRAWMANRYCLSERFIQAHLDLLYDPRDFSG